MIQIYICSFLSYFDFQKMDFKDFYNSLRFHHRLRRTNIKCISLFNNVGILYLCMLVQTFHTTRLGNLTQGKGFIS